MDPLSSKNETFRSSLHSALCLVPDKRKYNRIHPLEAILSLAVCAVLCGARSEYAIAQWGRDHGASMANRLGFTRGKTPCHASIHNVFKRLDVAAFEAALTGWIAQFSSPSDKKRAHAIDGKWLRGIHGDQVPGVLLISLFSLDLGLPAAQHCVTEREGELTGAKELLARLDLKGVVISGDALYCQRDLCEEIVEKGGDYLVVVKGNQPELLRDITMLFDHKGARTQKASQTSYGHSRVERRDIESALGIEGHRPTPEFLDWPGVGQALKLTRTTLRDGKTTVTTNYAITSLPPSQLTLKQANALWRGRWKIENQLHWIRDVVFDEDRSQVRTGTAPQAMAAVRNAAITAIKLAKHTNIAAALRTLAAKPYQAVAMIGVPH